MNAFSTTNFNLLERAADALCAKNNVEKIESFCSRNYSTFAPFLYVSIRSSGRKRSSSKWKFNDVQIGFMLISAWITQLAHWFLARRSPGTIWKMVQWKKGGQKQCCHSSLVPWAVSASVYASPLHICLLFKHKMTLCWSCWLLFWSMPGTTIRNEHNSITQNIIWERVHVGLFRVGCSGHEWLSLSIIYICEWSGV